MTEQNADPLFEDKFARTYAEIRRLDQLRELETRDREALAVARERRLDERMDAMEKAVAAALASTERTTSISAEAQERALTKAETAQQKVNETQNEFRATLRDQATTFMPRNETENLVRELRELIAANARQLTDLRSRIDVGPPSLSTLQSRSDESIGRRSGALDARSVLFAVLGAVGVIVGILATVIAITTR